MRKRIAVLLSALSMMMVMSVPPVMADPGFNRGNKGEDGLDPNNGGGQEHIENPRPPHGGGVQPGDGEDGDNGGGND